MSDADSTNDPVEGAGSGNPLPPAPNCSATSNATRRDFLVGSATAGGVILGLGHFAVSNESDSSAQVSQATTLSKETQHVNQRLYSFVGGASGAWKVSSMTAVTGDNLPIVPYLDVVHRSVAELPKQPGWILRGVTSNERYTTRDEKTQMLSKQAPLGRPECTHAVLIPIRKNAAWWGLTQDERRAIFEERSRHTTIGLNYLPGIARRLHHCRDLETVEPFDFLTFFDFAKTDANAFDDLLAELRATEEWKYIDWEVDIRLEKAV